MLAYRSGWRISLTAVATNVAATIILIPVGLLVFKENLSLRNVVGVLFCLLGLALVVRD
jgi:drug/metabolite transporter (DMT)-like permease